MSKKKNKKSNKNWKKLYKEAYAIADKALCMLNVSETDYEVLASAVISDAVVYEIMEKENKVLKSDVEDISKYTETLSKELDAMSCKYHECKKEVNSLIAYRKQSINNEKNKCKHNLDCKIDNFFKYKPSKKA